MSHIEGITALVTGAASGIGLLLATRLLEAGARHVVLWDVNGAMLESEASALAGRGFSVSSRQIDLTDTDAIEAAGRDLEIDILINNAGIVVGKTFQTHSRTDIDRTMAVNAISPIQLARVLLPGMLARGHGHIVNIASAAGLTSNPNMSVYCASKFALNGWSDSLWLEMTRTHTGVHVTTVTPFYINTGMFDGVRSPIVPILEPEDAVRRIMRAIRKNKRTLRMPAIIRLVPLLKGLLPGRLFDVVGGEWFGVYRSMDSFRGRK